MADQSQQTLSIPSLLILAAISALAVRYFFFSPASSSSNNNNRSTSRTADPADIEQIAQMFPQVPRRNIMWDLQRNGGSVAATTERILGRGGLDMPPPTFQPHIPGPTAPSTSRASPVKSLPEQVDLIKRYNLADKLSGTTARPAEEEDVRGKAPGWSNNKNERQALLQKRRDEMVLAARRKMEEKEKAGRTTT